MDPTVFLTSAVVAAVVGGLVTYFGQRLLAERQAHIDYESNARKRLYEAIGPLRLQLLFAARDLSSRVESHAEVKHWNMDPNEYYAKSFIYRILRPIAIGLLIERKMSVADFAVDEGALGLLRFNTTAYRMLTGGQVILGHPGVDWRTQSQHVFRDNLSAAAGVLITEQEEAGEVVMDFAKFSEIAIDSLNQTKLKPLENLFRRCDYSLLENPILWTRLVGYGYACRQFVQTYGTHLGFSAPEFPLVKLLGETEDKHINERINDFPALLAGMVKQGL